MNDNISDILKNHDWEDAILKLTAYTITLCKFRHSGNLPGGIEPEDIVTEAIERVYTGERNWNPEKDHDLNQYLKSVIMSILNKIIVSPRNQYTVRLSNQSEEDYPVNNHINNEIYCKELDSIIVEQLRDDPALSFLYKALKDGYKPGEIATEYGLDILVIRNTQKRLSRLILKTLGKTVKVNGNG